MSVHNGTVPARTWASDPACYPNLLLAICLLGFLMRFL